MNKDLETILEHSEVLTDETLEKFIKRTEQEIIEHKTQIINKSYFLNKLLDKQKNIKITEEGGETS
jgi:hypothetical protein|tara:strand:- start:17 stop:214 length:198 start_codon:yes stop_codon:yes gene_type:complete